MANDDVGREIVVRRGVTVRESTLLALIHATGLGRAEALERLGYPTDLLDQKGVEIHEMEQGGETEVED